MEIKQCFAVILSTLVKTKHSLSRERPSLCVKKKAKTNVGHENHASLSQAGRCQL